MPSGLQPVLLEVLATMPTGFYHCMHCERLFDAAGIGAIVHREILSSYPPDMLEEAGRLAAWLQELSARYGERLQIRVLDPQSPEGFIRSLRHWARRYPAFIVNRQEKIVGWEREAVACLLEEQMARRGFCDRGRE